MELKLILPVAIAVLSLLALSLPLLKKVAAKTPTDKDDKALEMAEVLIPLLQQLLTGVEKNAKSAALLSSEKRFTPNGMRRVIRTHRQKVQLTKAEKLLKKLQGFTVK